LQVGVFSKPSCFPERREAHIAGSSGTGYRPFLAPLRRGTRLNQSRSAIGESFGTQTTCTYFGFADFPKAHPHRSVECAPLHWRRLSLITYIIFYHVAAVGSARAWTTWDIAGQSIKPFSSGETKRTHYPIASQQPYLLTWRGALSATMLHPYLGGWHSLGKPTVIPPEVSHSGHFAIAPRGTTLATFPPFRPDTKVLNATSVRLRQRTGRICTVCTTTKLIPFSVHTK